MNRVPGPEQRGYDSGAAREPWWPPGEDLAPRSDRPESNLPATVVPQPAVVVAPAPGYPQQRRGGGSLRLGLLTGLLIGLVLFGTTGFLLGVWTYGGGGVPGAGPASAHPSASASATLSPYEQSQLALNRPKFSGDLAPFAESWLTSLSGCSKNSEPGGPKLGEEEETRITCSLGAVTAYFVQYRSIAARDKARSRYLAQNIDAKQLTPGAADPAQKKTASGNSSGNYLEYAYKITSGDRAGRTVCGLWWDNNDTPVAGYLLAYWAEGLGESWVPLRDLWQRMS